MAPSSVKHSNREERDGKTSLSEKQQIKTRACNGSGLEFGSFSAVDCFLFPGLCRESTHQTANTSQQPRHRRCGGDASVVHFSVTQLHSHLRVGAPPACGTASMCLDMHAWDRCTPGCKHAPLLFSAPPACRCFPSSPPTASDDGKRRARKQIVIALNGLCE